MTFLTASGQVITRQYPVAAQKRLTLYANDIPELAGKDFSTTITAATGVVAERAMYWRLIGSPDPSWVGGAASVGAIAPQTTWVFAEGAAAPNFESFYLLLNPNSTALTVRARFLPETGMPTVRNITIAPRSRATVYLNGVLGNIGGVASTFTSDTLGFLAERSIYWGAGRVEGTNVIGASSAANAWHFPEGASGGLFDTYLLLANPGTHDSTVRLTLFIEGRRPLHRVAGRAVEDGPRRLAPDHLHERVPLRARNGRSPSGRQPARQVVQHQDRGAERRSGGRGRSALLALGRRQLLARRLGRVRHPAVVAIGGGGALAPPLFPAPPTHFPHIAHSPAADRLTGSACLAGPVSAGV